MLENNLGMIKIKKIRLYIEISDLYVFKNKIGLLNLDVQIGMGKGNIT